MPARLDWFGRRRLAAWLIGLVIGGRRRGLIGLVGLIADGWWSGSIASGSIGWGLIGCAIGGRPRCWAGLAIAARFAGAGIIPTATQLAGAGIADRL
jgi:hypothetical protein